MYRPYLLTFTLAAVCLAGPVAVAEENQSAGAPDAGKVDAWIKALGSERFAERVEAENNLKAAGTAAQDALEKASKSEDPETKSRASRLLLTLKTEPILVKMAEAIAKAKTFEADMKMQMAMMGMQTAMDGHYKGTADGKKLVMDATMAVMGQNMKLKMVSDGTTMWTETTPPGAPAPIVQKISVATMQKMAGQKGGQNPLDSVKQMREQFDFTELREDKIDDRDVYVLTGKLKPGIVEEKAKTAGELAGPQAAEAAKAQMQGFDKSIMYVDKEKLFLRKSEVLDAQGNNIMTMELLNMKLNVELEETAFTYTPPEGAQVMDMDAMMKQAREGQTEEGGEGGMEGFDDGME